MKKVIVLVSIIIVSTVAGVVWWENGKKAPDPTSESSTIFVVKKGDGVREITNNLKEKGLIKSRIVFFLLIKQLGLEKEIEAGDFRLSLKMTAEQIALSLTHGTLDIWITIPEGKRAEEIAQILEKEYSTYDPSWQNILMANEGYLFPDTYLMPKDANISMIVSQMRDNFEKKYSRLDTTNTKLAREEIVILASLIEREAKFEEDRPHVASVIINRLDIGMKLDIDATVQYALGYSQEEKNWWKKNLTLEDLEVNSPFNTYRIAGFPPNPIANPGIDALRAATNPANTNYLYYISDKSGYLHFAKTLQEHNSNIKTYL